VQAPKKSHRVTRWQQQQQHGCDNIICCQQAPRAFNNRSLKRRQMARNRVQAHNINISGRAMATTYYIVSRDGNDDNNTAVITSYVVNKPFFILALHGGKDNNNSNNVILYASARYYHIMFIT
jgi:hypothetical protein